MMRPSALLAAVSLLAGCPSPSSSPDGGEPADPVRLPTAEEPACDRFELRGGLALDKDSGLQWTRFVSQEVATHEQARERCAALGMRLPVRAELETLLEEGRRSCDLPCGFHGHGCATLLCDSRIPGTEDHWGVSFMAGALVLVPQALPQGYVCVR